MKEVKNIYPCETCKKNVPQVYGNNVNGKYTFQCVICTFKKK